MRNYKQLNAEERERIAIGLSHGSSVRAIARTLDRSNSTISREIKRNGSEHYCGVIAQQGAQRRSRQPRRRLRLQQRVADNRLVSHQTI